VFISLGVNFKQIMKTEYKTSMSSLLNGSHNHKFTHFIYHKIIMSKLLTSLI
jgi:hypothetical protein